MELKLDGMELVNRNYNARRYSESVKAKRRASRIEKAKTKLALSIIGGSIIGVPMLYGMLFLITLV